MVLGIGQVEFPDVLVSMASMPVLGDAGSVKIERLAPAGEMRLANSKAMVWSPAERLVVLPTFVLGLVPVGTGTIGVGVVVVPVPVAVAAAIQGPIGEILNVPQVVSPLAPVQPLFMEFITPF